MCCIICILLVEKNVSHELKVVQLSPYREVIVLILDGGYNREE